MSDQINKQELIKQVSDLKAELYTNRISSDKSHIKSDIKRKIARLYTIINSVQN